MLRISFVRNRKQKKYPKYPIWLGCLEYSTCLDHPVMTIDSISWYVIVQYRRHKSQENPTCIDRPVMTVLACTSGIEDINDQNIIFPLY